MGKESPGRIQRARQKVFGRNGSKHKQNSFHSFGKTTREKISLKLKRTVRKFKISLLEPKGRKCFKGSAKEKLYYK